MQTIDDQVYIELVKFADQRGVTIQGLIRAVIVPEWFSSQRAKRGSPTNAEQVLDDDGAQPSIRNSGQAITAKDPAFPQR